MGDDAFDDLGADPGDDTEGELAATFRPIPGGAACYFAPAQAGVIRSLVGQVAELITNELGGDPDDLTAGEPGQPGQRRARGAGEDARPQR